MDIETLKTPSEYEEVESTEETIEEVEYNSLVETVGLMFGGFFIKLWTIITTVVLDIVFLLASFFKFIGTTVATFFSNLTASFREEFAEFRLEYLEAKQSVRRDLKRAPFKFIPTLHRYRKLAFSNHPEMFSNIINTALPVLGLAVLIATITHWSSTTFALQVESSGQNVGIVADENVYIEAQNLVKERFSTDLSADKTTEGLKTTYKVVTAEPQDLSDSQTISDSMVESTNAESTYACGIYLDGEFLCATNTETEAMQAFNNILDKYEKTNDNDVVGFVEDVQYVQGIYANNEDTIWDSEKLATALSSKTATEKRYTVKDGDTLSSIAFTNGLTVAQLKELNPDIKDTIKTGDELLIQGEKNTVRVKVIKTEVKNVSTPYETVKTNNDSIMKGTTKTTQKGQNGTDQVTYLVTYVDGVKVSTQEVNRVTVKKPVTEKISVGTKVNQWSGYYQASSYKVARASLVWPVVGSRTVSSPYGPRWGSFHTGIDISGRSGLSIVAARSGMVITAGWSQGGYGEYVIIDHGDGMRTLYGHMIDGSLCVSAGQYVSAGQPVGLLGSTGFSTGPHLHFEVIINGNYQDPAPYIGA